MSERRINLNDLWKEKYPNSKFPESERELVMKFAKQLLELAFENAIVTQEPVPAYEFVVVKQSILDTIKQVE